MSKTVISGVIYKINPEERYGDFYKRTFWIQELNIKYPNTWQLEMWHDDTSLLNSYKIGDIVRCSITIRGKLYNKSNSEIVLTILKCDKIERLD